MKDAVLLMAYGSPARIEDVPAYFDDVRGGRPVSDEAVMELVERYRRIGGSPLETVTEKVTPDSSSDDGREQERRQREQRRNQRRRTLEQSAGSS